MTEYAHFVGRIGGLAAALGVGIALTAATPAVVHADTGSESSPTTNSSTNTSTSPSGTSGTNPPAGTTATPSGATELPSSNSTTASAPGGTHTPPTQPATAIHATSNGGSLNTAPQNAQSTPEVEPLTSVDSLTATGAPAASESVSAPTTPTDTPPTPADATATPSPNAVTAADPPPSTTNNANATGNSKPTAAPLVQATTNPVAATIPPTTTALTTLALSSVSSSPTTSLNATSVVAKSTALTTTATQVTAQVAALAPAAAASTTMPTLISTVVTTIDGFLRNIVTAAMNLTAPNAPLDNPLAWTILAWTRRTFFNQAPTLNPQQLTTNSQGVITGTLGALDADGDPLTYTITQQPTHGTVTVNPDSTYTYTPDLTTATFDGTDTFTVTVSDNAEPTTTRVNLTVTAVVQSVAISPPDASAAVTVKIVATDPLGRPLTYRVLTPPASATGTLTPNTTPGEYTYTPTTDARVSAATGGPTTDTFTIAVTPTTNPNAYTTITITAQVAPATITLTVRSTPTNSDFTVVSSGTLSTTTDPSGIPVAYSVTTEPKYGKVDINLTTGKWTYTPTIEAVIAAANGGPTADTFAITAYDSAPNASALYDTVPITVHPPITQFVLANTNGTPASAGGGTGTAFVLPVGNQWIYSATAPVSGNGSNVVIGPTTGTFTYTPNAALADSGGTDTFTITATDPNNPTITYSSPVLVTVKAKGAGSVFPSPDNNIEFAVTQAAIGSSTGTTAEMSKSSYAIGTSSPPPPPPPPPPPTRPTVPGGSSGGELPSTTLAPAAVAGTCTNGADGTQRDVVDPRCTDQPIVNSPDNPHAGSPEATPAPANGPIHEPTANNDPTRAHTQTPPFDLIAWLLGIDLQQLLPQPADPSGPLAPPLDRLNPTANPDAPPTAVNGPTDTHAEGQPFDIFTVLDIVLGLHLDTKIPGPTDLIAPANPLNSPTPMPGTP